MKTAGLSGEVFLKSTAKAGGGRMVAGTGLAAQGLEPGATRRYVRIGTLTGYAGAVCWVAMGVDSVLRPWQDNRRDTFWLLPFALTIVAFYCVHRVQQGRSKLELPAFWTVMIASALTFLGSIG